VLVITGPVGAGKSTIAVQAATLLPEADIPHGLVDLDWIEQCWPVPAGLEGRSISPMTMSHILCD
jgi:Mrp family chromosome partitioning ATPase